MKTKRETSSKANKMRQALANAFRSTSGTLNKNIVTESRIS